MSTDPFEYDVALSYASEDLEVAGELARLLGDRGITVYRDEYSTDQTWGHDVVDHIVNLYARKARYCLLLISKHYPLRKWTEVERKQARERALRDAEEYVIPIPIGDYKIPGIREASGFDNFPQNSLDGIVELLEEKLTETRNTSGPPTKSHDLRSGNVPSTHNKTDSL